jgi:hypothetical protein
VRRPRTARRASSLRRPTARLAALAIFVAATAAGLVWSRSSLAQEDARPGDAGAPIFRPGPPIEVLSPDGLAPGERGCTGCVHACSFRHPFCVEAARGTASPLVLATIAAGDRAWEALTGIVGAPAPDGGIDGVWHVELADRVEGAGDAWLTGRTPLGPFDRGSSLAKIDRSLRPGCALDLAFARAIARGSLWRAAPATDEGSARAEAETMARLATPCAVDDDDTRIFQSHPERAVVEPLSPAYERGASLFFGWLDATFGAEPGGFVVGLWALAPTRTPFDSPRWAATPTGFDVLRVSLQNALWPGSTLEDAFVRFAAFRAFTTPPARVAWHLPWPSHARRLAAPEALEPTGASYVLVDHAGAPPGSRLRLEPEWEDFGRMRWFVVKLDAQGRELATVPVGSLDRGTHASITVESLDGVDRVLVVGVNVGSTEGAFDPGQGEWEPHGWLLTLEGE